MNELHDLEVSLNSRTPTIIIESQEELRIIQLMTQLGMRLQHPLFRWSVTDGLQRLEIDYDPQRTRPLSVVMREKIQQLRHWAADRTVQAD